MAYNKTEHLRRNIDAIRTAFTLEKEGSHATLPSGKYCGHTVDSVLLKKFWSRCRTNGKQP